MDTTVFFPFQVLVLLLLSMPQALSNKAELEVPLWSPVFSLLFYLVFLVLSALHVIVCTSAESSCYFCGLSWLTAGGVMALISALLCAVVSALAKVFADGRLLRKVRLIFPCRTLAIVSYFAVLCQTLVNPRSVYQAESRSQGEEPILQRGQHVSILTSDTQICVVRSHAPFLYGKDRVPVSVNMASTA